MCTIGPITMVPRNTFRSRIVTSRRRSCMHSSGVKELARACYTPTRERAVTDEGVRRCPDRVSAPLFFYGRQENAQWWSSPYLRAELKSQEQLKPQDTGSDCCRQAVNYVLNLSHPPT